jgi:hypothetical protein
MNAVGNGLRNVSMKPDFNPLLRDNDPYGA